MQVKQMTEFRQMLPTGAVTYVCKNTLLRVAAEKQGWQSLIPSTKASSSVTIPALNIMQYFLPKAVKQQMLQGENAWVFVSEECIAESVKSYHDFEKKLLEKYPKEIRKDMHPTAITGKHPS